MALPLLLYPAVVLAQAPAADPAAEPKADAGGQGLGVGSSAAQHAQHVDIGLGPVQHQLQWPEPSYGFDGSRSVLQRGVGLEAAQPRAPGPWEVPLAHAFGLMTAMRLGSAALWPKPFADLDPLHWAAHYGEAFSLPPRWDSSQRAFEWDGDSWTVNVIGHGLFGSELYMRVRTCRRGPVAAVLFATAAAATWEYVFEANAVRPSGLDLWYTPLAGALLGEARYWAWKQAKGLSDANWRTVLTIVLDPLGELGRAVGSPC